MNILAGYVERVSKFPLKSGAFTLFGQWTSFNMVPGESITMYQYRNQFKISEWSLHSISSFSGKEIRSDLGITIASEKENQDILIGDIFIDSRYKIEFFRAHLYEENPKVVIGSLKGYETICQIILFPTSLDHTIAIILDNQVDIILSNEVIITDSGLNIQVQIESLSICDEYPLEVKIEDDSEITLKEFINIMNPIRSCLVDAGRDFYLIKPTKRISLKTNIFEPKLSLKVGSIRVLLTPLDKGQLNLFVNSDAPYILFYNAMELAERGTPLMLTRFLSSKLYDIRKYLYHMQEITRKYIHKPPIKIIHGSKESLNITQKSFLTVENAIKMLERRKVIVIGELYAVDTKRNWFKVIEKHTGIDWKFVTKKNENPFSSLDSVASVLISVEGVTSTPEFSIKGTADFIKLL